MQQDKGHNMDRTPNWQAQQRPPFLPPPNWQRPTSSLAPATPNDLGHPANESQAVAETHTGKLVAGLDPTKIQEVAASQVVITDIYYKNILQHAQQLFRWALIAMGTGLVFFLIAVALLIFQQPVNGAMISLLSGTVIEAIAALNFYLYGRTLGQSRELHERLDRTQQYLLANSLCESLEGGLKHSTQIELIRAMMNSLAMREEKVKEAPAK